MTTLSINDLSFSKELDNKALAAVTGRGTQLSFLSYGANWYDNWSFGRYMSSSLQGYRHPQGMAAMILGVQSQWNPCSMSTSATHLRQDSFRFNDLQHSLYSWASDPYDVTLRPGLSG